MVRVTGFVKWLGILLALAVLMVPRGRAQGSIPVVPEANGFGMNTRAAYGGGGAPAVHRVTNLNDSGSGSLRAAMEASGPRVVVFEVSGTIALSSPIIVRSPYLTVAGQTAPSPGVTLRNYGIELSTNDVLLQHFRVRPGGNTCNNGLEAWGAASYNIVLDHMSVSWGQDENVVFYNGSRAINATLWRSIVAEGLHLEPALSGCAGGSSESHGLLVYDHTRNVSVLESLFASNGERNPYPKGATVSYFANNLFYNWGNGQGAFFGDPDGSGALQSTFTGNHYRRGPSTPSGTWMAQARHLQSGSRVFIGDNLRDGTNIEEFSVINNEGVDPRVGTAPVVVSGFTPASSSQVWDLVLGNAGARPDDRDGVDARIVQEVTSRGGRVIDTESQVGGWPTLAINRRALTLPTNPNDVTSSGYTNLEKWLHSYADIVEGRAAPQGPIPPGGVRVQTN
jgi:hypothetical protein